MRATDVSLSGLGAEVIASKPVEEFKQILNRIPDEEINGLGDNNNFKGRLSLDKLKLFYKIHNKRLNEQCKNLEYKNEAQQKIIKNNAILKAMLAGGAGGALKAAKLPSSCTGGVALLFYALKRKLPEKAKQGLLGFVLVFVIYGFLRSAHKTYKDLSPQTLPRPRRKGNDKDEKNNSAAVYQSHAI